MLRQEIITMLMQNHEDFFICLRSLPDDKFNASFDGKWSPHKNLEHIQRAVQPLVLAYKLPKWTGRILFGKSNRPSKNYVQLISAYQNKLAKGGKASGRFIPPEKNQPKEELIHKIQTYLQKICKAVDTHWSETDLDKYIFPHPLLGKLTAREMLYFTAYHVQHHKELVEKYYR